MRDNNHKSNENDDNNSNKMSKREYIGLKKNNKSKLTACIFAFAECNNNRDQIVLSVMGIKCMQAKAGLGCDERVAPLRGNM